MSTRKKQEQPIEDDEIVRLPKKTSDRIVYISHSGLNDFLTCRRLYYYKYILKLELDKLNIPFLAGRIIHLGISALLQVRKDAIEMAKKELGKEVKQIKKAHPEITTEQETKIDDLDRMLPGLLQSYKARYAKFIREHEHLHEEVPFEYRLNDRVVVVGKIDNLLWSKRLKKMFTHELKSSSYITIEYVRTIQTDPQTSLYHAVIEADPTIAGMKKGQKMGGVIYDVVRKPSIRQKQKESKQEFSNRLLEWYDTMDGQQRFHMETIERPLITPESLFNTYTRATNDILASKEKEDYYQNFNGCVRDWGFCEYYDLCHFGETKENLVKFRNRPRHHVNAKNSPVKKGK